MKLLVEGLKVVAGVAPSEDVYEGNPASDVVSMREYQRVMFILRQKTAGTNTGRATVTIEACSSAAAGNPEAIPFSYWKNEAVGTDDDMSAKQSALAAGFLTTANKDALYLIEVRASDLPSGKPFVRMQLTQSVDDPVKGDVIILAGEGPEGNPDTMPTAVA